MWHGWHRVKHKPYLLLLEALSQETSDRTWSGFEPGDHLFSTYAKFTEKKKTFVRIRGRNVSFSKNLACVLNEWLRKIEIVNQLYEVVGMLHIFNIYNNEFWHQNWNKTIRDKYGQYFLKIFVWETSFAQLQCQSLLLLYIHTLQEILRKFSEYFQSLFREKFVKNYPDFIALIRYLPQLIKRDQCSITSL